MKLTISSDNRAAANREVIDHYVPPDIAPSKERKLIIASGALKDLQRLRREDEDKE
jgi:hypothetical protein